MMRRATVQEVADWFRSDRATPIDHYRRQAHRIGRLAVVLKQADDLLPVAWINARGFDEDKQKRPIKQASPDFVARFERTDRWI